MLDGNYVNVGSILNQTRSTCAGDANWYYIQFGYQSGIGQNDSVLHYMNNASSRFPKNDSILYLNAVAYGLQYDSAEAVKGIKLIDRALDLKKKNAYLVCRSQLCRISNQLNEAIETLTYIKNIDRDYDALVEKGLALKENKKYKEALVCFNKAIAIDKFYPVAYMEKATLMLFDLNNQDAALALLDTVEMIDSTLADPSLLRAEFFENVGDFDNAIAEYDQAIQTDSSIHQVYLLRSNCLIEVREFDLAEEDINRYKKLYPDDKDVNYLIADLYIAKGDFNGAAMLMSQMEGRGESTYDLYIKRGISYANNGQYDNAIEDFTKAERFPDRDFELYFQRGKCLFMKNEFRKAKYDFEKAKNMQADEMEIHYWHCKAAYHAGFKDEACASCKIAKFHNFNDIEPIYLKECNE